MTKMTSKLLGFVGWSGSGKTTLLEHLLPKLAAKGLRVNVIKHSHHDLTLEPAGKDSARMRAAGAEEVMLTSPFRYVLTHELRGTPEPSLDHLVARMQPADLTLVEGFKWEAIPKLEIFRPALGKQPQYPEDENIIAVASDALPPTALNRPLIWLDLNQPDQVLAWLLTEKK
jgi:molybdopterin-guanine dinucleotide biosynthesis protein B